MGVAEPQGADLIGAEQPTFPAEVQYRAVAAEYGGDEGRVAGQFADGVTAQQHTVGQGARYLAGAVLGLQGFRSPG